MDEVTTGVETVTSVAAELGPLLSSAAQEPLTYGLALGLAGLVYWGRKRKAGK